MFFQTQTEVLKYRTKKRVLERFLNSMNHIIFKNSSYSDSLNISYYVRLTQYMNKYANKKIDTSNVTTSKFCHCTNHCVHKCVSHLTLHSLSSICVISGNVEMLLKPIVLFTAPVLCLKF